MTQHKDQPRPPKILPVLLCGGSGTRLWPLSRLSMPKQFLRLMDGRSLFQQTVARLANLPESLPPLVVCHGNYRHLACDHLKEIGVEPLMLIKEPAGRNTGPAIAAAAFWAARHAPDAVLLCVPCDHAVSDEAAFSRAVADAVDKAQLGKIAIFGVAPERPETQYGYIREGEAGRVERFVEKPDSIAARNMHRQGGWFWNSGMFCFTPQIGVAAFQAHAPELCAVESWIPAAQEEEWLLDQRFSSLPAIAFDRAVMEKTGNAVMVKLEAGWADLGTWKSIWQAKAKNADGNACEGEVLLHKSRNCFVRAGKRLVAVAGAENLVVIDTEDALLVAHADHAGQAGAFADALIRRDKNEALRPAREQRPWGHFECMESRPHFKVKHLTVRPGGQLSLQMHRFRAEHWVVVSGKARVTCGDRVFTLEANQSTYIPVGMVHRLENPGGEPLEIIEVQTGSVCDESDIVRFEDDYRRAVVA